MKILTCTLCATEKPTNEFYKNKGMPSGYANQCKECVKARSKAREERLRQSPEWVEAERIRAGEKHKRLNYGAKYLESARLKKPWTLTSKYKNLHRGLRAAGKINEGEVVHHWNYNYLDSYFIMTKANHRKLHIELTFDESTLCFIGGGDLLDSKSKHSDFICKLGLK